MKPKFIGQLSPKLSPGAVRKSSQLEFKHFVPGLRQSSKKRNSIDERNEILLKQLIPKKKPFLRQISPVLSNDGKVRMDAFVEKFTNAAGNIEKKTRQPTENTTPD